MPGRLATLVTLVEWLTGQRVHVLDPDELGPRRAAGTQPAAPEQLPGAGGPAAGRGSAAAAAGGRASAGWGLELTTTTVSVRREQTAFAATGAVTTADGRRIDMAVDLFWSAQRSATSSTRRQAGEAAATDRAGAPEPGGPTRRTTGWTAPPVAATAANLRATVDKRAT